MTSHGCLVHPNHNPPWAAGKSEVISGEKAMFIWCTNSGISDTVFREGGFGVDISRFLELYTSLQGLRALKERRAL